MRNKAPYIETQCDQYEYILLIIRTDEGVLFGDVANYDINAFKKI